MDLPLRDARLEDASGVVEIARALSLEPLGFAVNGDGGSGFSRDDVRHAISTAPSGAVVLLHMNHPRGQTAEGVQDAVRELSRRGVSFVLLRQLFPTPTNDRE